MAHETLIYEKTDGIGLIKLHRPKVLNALNDQLITELSGLIAEIRVDAEVKVVILTGEGDKAFAAGADIGELSRARGLAAVDLARKGQRLTRDIELLGKPVIAAVNGFALGGGCELAMACTLRIASTSASFGQPEVNLGIIPGYGGTQRLTRLIGKGRALELVLTGRMVKAEEALAIGLCSAVHPPMELMDGAHKLAKTLMGKGPIALRLAVEAVHGGLELSLDEALSLEAHLFGVCAATEDTKEGLAAFLEKRKPEFKGR